MLARIRKSDNEEGFTLIELLVVVIIIGILSAIAIPTFLKQREKGWNAAAQSALKNAATAQESWRSENPAYVSMLSGAANLKTEGFNASATTPLTLVVDGTATGYCMSAKHSNGGLTYYLTAGGGAPTTTACTAAG